MAWSPEAMAAICGFPEVFASPSQFGTGISFSDPLTGRFLLSVADYLDAGVKTLCVPPLMIAQVVELDGALELTIRVATPVRIAAE